jgi:hypothetical protein
MAIVLSYSELTARLGPLAQWRFDEAGGALAIDRADGLNGSYRGSVTFGESGATGADGAVRLGGNGSFVEIQSASGGSFAVELAAFGDSLVRFVIARLADGIDRIADFQPGAGGDVLDLGSIVRGFQPSTSRVADFVRLETSSGDTRVAVDDDGADNDFAAVADLAGVSGVTLNQLVTDGNRALT